VFPSCNLSRYNYKHFFDFGGDFGDAFQSFGKNRVNRKFDQEKSLIVRGNCVFKVKPWTLPIDTSSIDSRNIDWVRFFLDGKDFLSDFR
jgi:hypothetical protein